MFYSQLLQNQINILTFHLISRIILMNKTEVIHMENINFNSKVYKSSRNNYVLYSMFEYFISILITDAFLATLLKNIGMSDALTGLISSFVSLAFLFQLLSIFILTRKTNAKALCITFETVSQLCFCFLYVIPFIPISKEYKNLLYLRFFI